MIARTIAKALLLVLLATPAFASDVAGNWTVSMTGPMGPESLELAITVDGNDLAITGKHSVLGDAQGTGTLDGDAITMTIGTTGDMKVGFVLEGTVDGDAMSGTREIKMDSGGGDAGGPPGGGPPGGGAPEGDGAPGGGDMGELPNEWTAVRK